MVWVNVVPHMPKSSRYTLGARIEEKFLDLLECTYFAYFSEKATKQTRISECILLLDTLKFLITMSWEAKLISTTRCEEVAKILDETGKMFGGWRKNIGQIETKTPVNTGES